jgi:hydrogenase expression/formation protein HypC
MCIAFPGKIISIDENMRAIIDISGVQREVRLDLVDDTGVGDYVICHAGFAIQKLDEETAHEMLDCLKEIMENEVH